MTIRDFVEMFVDESLVQITVYNMAEGDNIHTCFGDELPDELDEVEIESIDIPTCACHFTVNIDVAPDEDNVRISDKLEAREKAIELAACYGGEMLPIDNFGYGFETDRETMREAAEELGLEVTVDEENGLFSAFLNYPDAGDEGQIFADFGGLFQHDDRCYIGVCYRSL